MIQIHPNSTADTHLLRPQVAQLRMELSSDSCLTAACPQPSGGNAPS
jgi:hypothetical protein